MAFFKMYDISKPYTSPKNQKLPLISSSQINMLQIKRQLQKQYDNSEEEVLLKTKWVYCKHGKRAVSRTTLNMVIHHSNCNSLSRSDGRLSPECSVSNSAKKNNCKCSSIGKISSIGTESVFHRSCNDPLSVKCFKPSMKQKQYLYFYHPSWQELFQK